MRSGHKGDLSELMVLTELLRENHEVAIPYGNRPGYDLLVKGIAGWIRIQVKTPKRSIKNTFHMVAKLP